MILNSQWNVYVEFTNGKTHTFGVNSREEGIQTLKNIEKSKSTTLKYNDSNHLIMSDKVKYISVVEDKITDNSGRV